MLSLPTGENLLFFPKEKNDFYYLMTSTTSCVTSLWFFTQLMQQDI